MKLAVPSLALLAACAAPQDSAPASAEPQPPSAPSSEPSDFDGELDRLVADLCGRDVVLLGEAAHGDGRTWEVKTEVVRRLVDSCGFDSVLVESGVYDFIALDHAYAEGTATAQGLSNAIGALWSGAREIQPLIADLHAAAAAGNVEVMGIDDQIHSTAFFGQQQLAALLASHLPDDRRAECQATIARHTAWTYDEEHALGGVNRRAPHDGLAVGPTMPRTLPPVSSRLRGSSRVLVVPETPYPTTPRARRRGWPRRAGASKM